MERTDQSYLAKAIIIGCGIAGPAMAIFLKRIGIHATIYEAQREQRDDAGVFLGISPNGLNVLKELMSIEKLFDDFTPGKMTFFNSKGKNIGVIETEYQRALYGCELVQLKRGLLNKALRQAASNEGIKIEFGKKLRALSRTGNTVIAIFEDGSRSEGHLLIGADGIHSVTRRMIFPNAPRISYTGQLGTGGYSRIHNAKELYGTIRMIFGEKAFFAYSISNRNEVWWFNNISAEVEPAHYNLQASDQSALKRKLIGLHCNDPYPISEIIEASEEIACYPIYDIPFLKSWYSGNVCLIGDAAHATAPHVGQGASLALEDTIVLAKCVRDFPTLEQAFGKFQSIRQKRVQHIIQAARKTGSKKTVPNRFQLFMRDLLLPIFIKGQAKKMHWIYEYKTEWNDRITG